MIPSNQSKLIYSYYPTMLIIQPSSICNEMKYSFIFNKLNIKASFYDGCNEIGAGWVATQHQTHN